MTHTQKIADYRAALADEEKYASRQLGEATMRNDRDDIKLWWGIRDGLQKAQQLQKMLD